MAREADDTCTTNSMNIDISDDENRRIIDGSNVRTRITMYNMIGAAI